MRALYLAAATDGRALSDEELSASLTATLAQKPKGAGWWVFGYGSLLWNPLFPVAEARAAAVHGLHRRFCLRSIASRGTPTQPGLVLDYGSHSFLLWRREMVVGAYRPRWVHVRAGDRRLAALTFVVRRDHVQYADLTHEDETRIIAQACGAFGSSCDYLMRTRAALASHGIVDRYLERLAHDVQVRQLECAAPQAVELK